MKSELVFGFDIGTTSIGSAVVRMDTGTETGSIRHLGVRIFPEARNPKGAPFNQERRQFRMIRRQIRRRRNRRRELNGLLTSLGLLPPFSRSPRSEWMMAMTPDPWALRARALQEGLQPFELGRALYHLAHNRHFRGRDLEETDANEESATDEASAEEKAAASQREKDRAALKETGLTPGAFLAQIPDRTERRRGHHFAREDVKKEFDRIMEAQKPHHPELQDPDILRTLEKTIFDQKPVFWRLGTLGHCRFVPGALPAASASWVAQEKRLLEKLNNLHIEEGNGRPLDEHERDTILSLLRKQDTASWGSIRKHLKAYWRQHDMNEKPTFNLERGGEKKLIGNRLENRMATILGKQWQTNGPLRERMRRELHARLYAASYGRIGQRIVIRREAERKTEREKLRVELQQDFGVTREQAEALAGISIAPGWEPFSEEALRTFLPRLQEGTRFGALLASPEEEGWRDTAFPERARPTGSWVKRLPTPGNSRDEVVRQREVRNPTVLRTQNELRKVINNLISVYGQPDRIRVEVARDVSRSARERNDIQKQMHDRETERKRAARDLKEKGIAEPTRADVEKWLLWKECREFCPYTGKAISFDSLFRTGEFEVEHIWPRSRSFDNGFANKTLCHNSFNARKSNRTPFEAYGADRDAFEAALKRVRGFAGPPKLVNAKARRFAATEIPEGFTSRQLIDTGYAARQAVGFLKQLFPDLGQESEVRVATVSGRVTAGLRHAWGLNKILSPEDGRKTRGDHRHHAVDALTIALAHPGYTQRLSRWYQAKDSIPPIAAPELPPPFADVREQAERKAAEIVVSHRVRRKVSGPLHKETVYGDAGAATGTGKAEYRWFVTRKPVEVLTKTLLADEDAWPDGHVHKLVLDWVESHGGDPKKAFAQGYPTVSEGGAPIRKVRIRVKQQARLMAPLKNGYADLGNNHHVAVFRHGDGEVESEVVSLFEAATRLRKKQPVVTRQRDGAEFIMSLAQGDTLAFHEGKMKGLWVVQGVWSAGPIVLWRAEDAIGATVFRPTPASILKNGGRKASVDPIGRIRPARD